MRVLRLSRKAYKFLDTLPPKQLRQLHSKINALCDNCKPNDCKKLKGYKNLYRVDSGEYRVVYKFDETVIYIDVIGKRNDGEIYQNL
jgi:mRNA interferase RelE/StbE